jgi:hypothetical protein
LLGAVGKTILVYAAAAGMLAGGLIIERRERYATWAKIVMACGWASLYATTFLIHILPGEAQLIKSPLIDMSLLAVIASGMIGHSFKYRSQQLTMTAYFIGFAGIAFTAHWAQQQFFSLVAGLVLGVSGVVVFGVMQWHRLMLLCLIGAYAVHGLWLHHMFGLFTTPVGHSAEFRPGLIITFLEWAAFTAALFVNRPEDEESELITLATATLNFALCVVLIKLQSSGQ